MAEIKKIDKLIDARKVMLNLVKDYFHSLNFQSYPAAANKAPKINRIKIEIPPISPLNWLSHQENSHKLYWSNRDDSFQISGVGQADIIESENGNRFGGMLDKIQQNLKENQNDIKYFGGFHFAFSASKRDKLEGWKPFSDFKMILPLCELIFENNKFFFAVNINAKKNSLQVDKILHEIDQLIFETSKKQTELPLLISRHDTPDRAGWEEAIKKSLDSIRVNGLKKIVLARQSLLEFEAEIDSLNLISRLKENAIGSFMFLFQFDSISTFLGATPELLYRREDDRITTEAIAGTRLRGSTEESDFNLENELLHSDKDVREQQYVVNSIRASLNELCVQNNNSTNPGSSKRSVLKLSQVQHLITKFQGKLKNKITDSSILSSLHPTPAVGGYPRAEALKEISSLEQFDRGWYAGPVGWISSNSAEFAVAIRSGLVQKNNLYLYSGAGILDGSKATDEWNEIENKISSFISILNIK